MKEYYRGIVKFIRIDRPDDVYNSYSIAVSLDDDSVAKYKRNGGQSKIGEENTVSFRRVHEKQLKKGEPVTVFGPPEVLAGEDGEEQPIENPNRLGVGSDVVIRVEHYNSKGGIGTRLDKIKVLDLVEREDAKPF